MNVEFSAKALFDIDSIAERIQQDSSHAAIRFLEAAEKTAKGLLPFPELGAVWESDDPDLQNLRVRLVMDFPKYLLFYRITDDQIIVVRVIHGHRNVPKALKE